MLTEDKSITTPGYWSKVYSGARSDAKIDASNNVRPKNAFDRFEWVADQVGAEETDILEVGAGHARVCERIQAKFPAHIVIASDQTDAAKTVSKFRPYHVFSAYNMPYLDKSFDIVIACQCLEYMEYQNIFLKEARRVARKLIVTTAEGEMKLWSQLRLYTEENLKELLTNYGEIEVFEMESELMLVKLKFND